MIVVMARSERAHQFVILKRLQADRAHRIWIWSLRKLLHFGHWESIKVSGLQDRSPEWCETGYLGVHGWHGMLARFFGAGRRTPPSMAYVQEYYPTAMVNTMQTAATEWNIHRRAQ